MANQFAPQQAHKPQETVPGYNYIPFEGIEKFNAKDFAAKFGFYKQLEGTHLDSQQGLLEYASILYNKPTFKKLFTENPDQNEAKENLANLPNVKEFLSDASRRTFLKYGVANVEKIVENIEDKNLIQYGLKSPIFGKKDAKYNEVVRQIHDISYFDLEMQKMQLEAQKSLKALGEKASKEDQKKIQEKFSKKQQDFIKNYFDKQVFNGLKSDLLKTAWTMQAGGEAKLMQRHQKSLEHKAADAIHKYGEKNFVSDIAKNVGKMYDEQISGTEKLQKKFNEEKGKLNQQKTNELNKNPREEAKKKIQEKYKKLEVNLNKKFEEQMHEINNKYENAFYLAIPMIVDSETHEAKAFKQQGLEFPLGSLEELAINSIIEKEKKKPRQA
ncbi:MAG: hypothetical protein ACOYT4_02670 [Nanoarchaeota archaeon]